MSARIITAKIGAYLSSTESARVLRSDDDAEIVDAMSFSTIDMSRTWTRLGEATITVTLDFDERQVITGQVQMLREKQRRIDAEAARVKTEIEREIQSLMAIEYTPEAT